MRGKGFQSRLPISDLHVLMVLKEGPLYGYALQKAVTEESGGAVAPEAASLYRILGRLMSQGLVGESPPPADRLPSHPGKRRKYYRITPQGIMAARVEASRLRDLVTLAGTRGLLPKTGVGL